MKEIKNSISDFKKLLFIKNFKNIKFKNPMFVFGLGEVV